MSDFQMGIFCLAGFLATFISAIILIILTKNICKNNNKVFKAILYYLTIIMLFLDPLYLSLLCGLFGGGDMNGIKLLVGELYARLFFGFIFVVSTIVFIKYILPSYSESFKKEN